MGFNEILGHIRRYAACSLGSSNGADGRTEESLELRERLDALEHILSSNGIEVPMGTKRAKTSLRKRSTEPGPASASSPAEPDLNSGASPAHSQGKAGSPSAAPSPSDPGQGDTPYLAFPSPPNVHSVRFDYNEPLPDQPSAVTGHGDGLSGGGDASSTSNALLLSSITLAPAASPEDQSFGTLVISHSGRSKYLGPTAASEWLKDVSLPRYTCGN